MLNEKVHGWCTCASVCHIIVLSLISYIYIYCPCMIIYLDKVSLPLFIPATSVSKFGTRKIKLRTTNFRPRAFSHQEFSHRSQGKLNF